MKKLLNKKGFTLIELIVVIAILAILALILVPSVMNYVAQAGRAKDEANARTIYSEIALAVATNQTVPSSPITKGGVTCNFTVSTGTNPQLTSFTCNYSGTTNVIPGIGGTSLGN